MRTLFWVRGHHFEKLSSTVQLYSVLTEGIPLEELGLWESPLLKSLKLCVVELARSANVLPSVQQAAQVVLRTGWEVLLPTVPERANALLQLIPNAEGMQNISHDTLFWHRE